MTIDERRKYDRDYRRKHIIDLCFLALAEEPDPVVRDWIYCKADRQARRIAHETGFWSVDNAYKWKANRWVKV